jgi:hypothetical protein
MLSGVGEVNVNVRIANKQTSQFFQTLRRGLGHLDAPRRLAQMGITPRMAL